MSIAIGKKWLTLCLALLLFLTAGGVVLALYGKSISSHIKIIAPPTQEVSLYNRSRAYLEWLFSFLPGGGVDSWLYQTTMCWKIAAYSGE